MVTIGITQRLITVGPHRETRDTLSHDWAHLIHSLGYHLVPLPNIPDIAISMAKALKVDGVILSNGEDIPAGKMGGLDETRFGQRERTELALLAWACEVGLSVLGVCRGCQFLHLHQGGLLAERVGHVASQHDVTLYRPLGDDQTRSVNSFHHYVPVGPLSSRWQIVAQDHQGSIEAIKHVEAPLWGIMWHPEREYFTHKEDDGFNAQLFQRVFQA